MRRFYFWQKMHKFAVVDKNDINRCTFFVSMKNVQLGSNPWTHFSCGILPLLRRLLNFYPRFFCCCCCNFASTERKKQNSWVPLWRLSFSPIIEYYEMSTWNGDMHQSRLIYRNGGFSMDDIRNDVKWHKDTQTSKANVQICMDRWVPAECNLKHQNNRKAWS